MLTAALALLPILWMEPVHVGRDVAPHDAIAICVSNDEQAIASMDAILDDVDSNMAGGSLPGCDPIDGIWTVERIVEDRCLDASDAVIHDIDGETPAVSCEVEGHAVVLASGGQRRYALMVMTSGQAI